tara:strand:- start:524 stop:739 length:216 start_codon:yes stop_codon:yes gene_type:complete
VFATILAKPIPAIIAIIATINAEDKFTTVTVSGAVFLTNHHSAVRTRYRTVWADTYVFIIYFAHSPITFRA